MQLVHIFCISCILFCILFCILLCILFCWLFCILFCILFWVMRIAMYCSYNFVYYFTYESVRSIWKFLTHYVYDSAYLFTCFVAQLFILVLVCMSWCIFNLLPCNGILQWICILCISSIWLYTHPTNCFEYSWAFPSPIMYL